MQRFIQNELEWLEFDLLADIPKLRHAVFLRKGGCSQGPFKSLNVGLNSGDNEAHVRANISIIENHINMMIPNWQGLRWGKGCHGKHIAYIDESSPKEIVACDGLMCSTPGLSLMMKHADCQIALFYDPKHHVIANIHSGWRGSALNIYAETILQMHRRFGSNPANLLVCISPSLGPNEAEFIHYAYELPEEFWSFQVSPTYFDFWSISEYQLQAAGILPHHIEIARLSTHSNSQDYFSYRRDKITGRHGTCITLLT